MKTEATYLVGHKNQHVLPQQSPGEFTLMIDLRCEPQNEENFPWRGFIADSEAQELILVVHISIPFFSAQNLDHQYCESCSHLFLPAKRARQSPPSSLGFLYSFFYKSKRSKVNLVHPNFPHVKPSSLSPTLPIN